MESYAGGIPAKAKFLDIDGALNSSQYKLFHSIFVFRLRIGVLSLVYLDGF